MSRASSYEHAPRPRGLEIALLDHTDPPNASFNDHDTDTELSSSEQSPTPNQLRKTLSKRLTNSSLQGSLKRAIERQKYARFQSSRYGPSLDSQVQAETSNQGETVEQPQRSRDILERGRAKAIGLWRGKRRSVKETERNAVVDVLYENQRGVFFFGVPRYSNKSLLQVDAKPWQNADFRTSAVDIRNAQVPDPSWEWAWNCWYVDMNRDVDEQGWEYSFAFGTQFAWHGNHPWFHSFVRRRRWLRKRVRKDRTHKTKERGHELAPDYFTIHTKLISASSQTEKEGWNISGYNDEPQLDSLEITDAGALSQHMRSARLDREKLLAMASFMTTGSIDDIQYLAQQMSEIMSLFIYQSSRRQLLGHLLQQYDEVHQRHEDLAKHEHTNDEDKAKHDVEMKRADAILEAVRAADQQIQKLEYWSDIRDIARTKETLSKDKVTDWDAKRWSGLKSSLATEPPSSKQDVNTPAAKLHKYPERHGQHNMEGSETDSSAYTTAPSMAPSAKAPKSPSTNKRPSFVLRRNDTDNSLERFVTASEGPISSIKPKQHRNKSGHRNLDGVAEGEEHIERPAIVSADEDEAPLREISAEDAQVIES